MTPTLLLVLALALPADTAARPWSFRPVVKAAPPTVANASWPTTAIDRFVLVRLEAKGLTPAPEADKRTLLRRLTFDLLGLPPTPAEVEAFVADRSPDAYARLVERLLASPRYGERWGRHWLDVARYADTKGYVFEEERRFPFSYTYRDYVIAAFNADKPYDRFVVEQLAADRLPLGDDRAPLAAMGYLTLGRRFLNNIHDIIDDRIDVVMRGLQGLTVTCARCHDHKFDPVPMRDYYALYGVFASSVEPRDLPILMPPAPTEAFRAYEAELKKRKEAVSAYEKENEAELKARNRKFRDGLRALQKKVEELKVTHPGAPPQAMVLVDAAATVNPVVFRRGNPNNRGEAVPRRFLEALSDGSPKPFADGSGRLDLAKAIVHKANPLTARVLVNRVWQHHFGKGLVRTPGDFGTQGEPPTHPELLDWLASEFVESGWSMKTLHRRILLSATYRQSSEASSLALAVDPENRLLARQNRRRLEYEALRDALLTAAGRLDGTAGGPPIDLLKAPFVPRRTVYGFVDRQNLPGVFRTFDLASPDLCTPQRHTTTVPQQALYLMNGPFALEQARQLATRPDVASREKTEERIDYLYRLLFARPADPEEIAAGRAFVAAASWEQYAHVLLMSNEFVYLD